MNKKQQKILSHIFKRPTSSDIAWSSIESLFNALGCEISEGSGSRIRVKLNEVRAVFHRLHPSPYTDKGAVDSVRKFLINAGVKP
jgi:hypothetical protein